MTENIEKKWKEKSRKVTDNMTFYPEFYRRNMLDAIDWLRERPCARRRGLGTKLPMFSVMSPLYTINTAAAMVVVHSPDFTGSGQDDAQKDEE